MDRVFKRCLITGIAGSVRLFSRIYFKKKPQQKYLGYVEVLTKII